ncbi:hypothetical protein HDU67_006040 [Dinochytrium kinnereticum]|nr:hypothetical protein HDU67_006040 [Dinochytrium kinnereticum]
MTGGSGSTSEEAPLWQNIVGISLALASGVLIGASVVFTKKGLIESRSREVGREHAYLRNSLWWLGMILMGLGEVANFGAYAFTAAILVTPLGALSVVISAVLSSIFLNERLNFPAKVGCAQCLVGATIIVLNTPSSTTTQTIDAFFAYVLAPGFLSFTALMIIALIFLVVYCEKRYAHKTPLVYISIASLIGPYLTLSTQGFGTSMIYSFRNWSSSDKNQFLKWPIYPLFAFMVFSIIIQIHYLNRAYSLFSTAIVTPIFYVTFTTATLLGSAILYQGFPVASVTAGLSIVMGFLVIVGGVSLLFQYSMQVLAQEAALVVSSAAVAAGVRSQPTSGAQSVRSVSRAGSMPEGRANSPYWNGGGSHASSHPHGIVDDEVAVEALRSNHRQQDLLTPPISQPNHPSSSSSSLAEVDPSSPTTPPNLGTSDALNATTPRATFFSFLNPFYPCRASPACPVSVDVDGEGDGTPEKKSVEIRISIEDAAEEEDRPRRRSVTSGGEEGAEWVISSHTDGSSLHFPIAGPPR